MTASPRRKVYHWYDARTTASVPQVPVLRAGGFDRDGAAARVAGVLMIPVASRDRCEYKIHSFRAGPGRCPAPASSRREPGTNGLGVAPVSPWLASLTAVSRCGRNRGYYRRAAPMARLQEI